jgi:cytochrome c-type biogenesis protein CcmH
MTAIVKHPSFRRWSWILIGAVLLVSLGRAAFDDGPPRTTEEQVRAVGLTIKCPTCRSQSVAGSDSAAAVAIRNDITARVEAGESADQIRTAIAAQYPDVQLIPRASGFEGLVWALPVAFLVLALAGLTATFARWRRAAARSASAEDQALVEQALAER